LKPDISEARVLNSAIRVYEKIFADICARNVNYFASNIALDSRDVANGAALAAKVATEVYLENFKNHVLYAMEKK